MTESDVLGKKTPKDLGLETGKVALNPLEEFSKIFGDAFDQNSRKQFLDSYLKGVTQFFESRGLVMPIGSDLDDILQPQGLSGFIKGLNREKPNIQESLDSPSGEYTDPKTWEYTLNLFSQHLYGEGYFIGFMIGIARDYGLTFSAHEVPASPAQYELFNQGLNAKPLVFSSLIGENFHFKEDQQIVIMLEKMIYEGGLKLWLHGQGLDVELASKISHPEALEAFKQALAGELLDLSDSPPDSPQLSGYSLGQTAR